MHKIICNHCSGIWFTEQSSTNNIKVCPFCGEAIRRNIEITSFDTLEKVLYKALQNSGSTAFDNPNFLISFMMDLAPEMRKEIRILSKSLTAECLKAVKTVFESSTDSIEVNISKLKYHLVEDEGLSDSWAELICSTYINTFNYLHGVGLGEEITAHIELVDFNQTNENLSSVLASMPITVTTPALSDVKPNNRRIATQAAVETNSVVSDSYETTRSNKLNVHSSSPPKEVFTSATPVAKALDNTSPSKKPVQSPATTSTVEVSHEFAALKKAAASGDATAQYQVGHAYAWDDNGTRDNIEAVKWYKLSASQGYVKAQEALGYCYMVAKGVAKDEKEALRWYEMAADQGSESARKSILRYYMNISNRDKLDAIRWFADAAELGNVDAMYYLAERYYQGKGVPRDSLKALKLLHHAKQKDNWRARSLFDEIAKKRKGCLSAISNMESNRRKQVTCSSFEILKNVGIEKMHCQCPLRKLKNGYSRH